MTKRTVTTIEIAERVVISARTDIPQVPCPVCAQAAMITPEAAAALAAVSVRSIYARIEAESVHFLETPDGLLLVCANSLGQNERVNAVKKLICESNPAAERTSTSDSTNHEGVVL